MLNRDIWQYICKYSDLSSAGRLRCLNKDINAYLQYILEHTEVTTIYRHAYIVAKVTYQEYDYLQLSRLSRLSFSCDRHSYTSCSITKVDQYYVISYKINDHVYYIYANNDYKAKTLIVHGLSDCNVILIFSTSTSQYTNVDLLISYVVGMLRAYICPLIEISNQCKHIVYAYRYALHNNSAIISNLFLHIDTVTCMMSI